MNTGGTVSMLESTAASYAPLHSQTRTVQEQFCAHMKFQVKIFIKQVHSSRWKSKFFQMKFQLILGIAVPGKRRPFINPSDSSFGFPYRKLFTQLTNYANISIC
jgi:hypothetical protein